MKHFYSPWYTLSLQQQHFLCESGWREVMFCVQRGGTLLKLAVQPRTRSEWFSFKFAQEFIIYSPEIVFMLLPWCTS